MPISGHSSYPAVVAQFLAHWEQVDDEIGGMYGIGLRGGVMREDFDGMSDDLEAARDAVTDSGVDRALARAELGGMIEVLQGRLVEFNRRVRADFAGSAYERSLSVAFTIGDAESAVREALRYMARLWERIDALPARPGVTLPLVLLENYKRTEFNSDRDALRRGYRTLSEAEVDLKVAREERNDLQDEIYEVLKAYRLKVPTLFAEGHALLDSLPVLTPGPGHTPAPVTAQGVWQSGTQQAKITWAASAEPGVESYQVRGVPGDDYQTDDEEVLATLAPGAPREFLTDFALGAPGVSAGFKVYVVLAGGNERGSDAVYVTRPE